MTGAYLEASRRGVLAVVDGFVSGAAALAAARIDPACRRVLLPSHCSAEHGTHVLLQALDAGEPALDMQLRLGEGTGAVLAVPLLRAAAAIMTDMASLDEVLAGKA